MGNISISQKDPFSLGTISLTIKDGVVVVTRRIDTQIPKGKGTITQTIDHEAHGSDGLTTFDGPPFSIFDGDAFSRGVAFRHDEFIHDLRELCVRDEITSEEQEIAERVLEEVASQNFWPAANQPSRSGLAALDADLINTTCVAELPTQLHSRPNAPISLLWRARLALSDMRDQFFGR